MELEITDAEIDNTERILGKKFDEERRKILQSITSQDIQACPGSGKTTSIVAKLIILSRKLPPNLGICILSHTNAARIEIQKALDTHTRNLFRYPHFIGTIQNFTDRFLAIPAMIQRYGIRPLFIDDETFARAAIVHSSRLDQNTRFYLRQRFANQGGLDIVKSLKYRFDNLDQLDLGNLSETSKSYQDLLHLKNEITREGCINFSDAYSLAHWYLKQFPNLQQLFSKRFQYVIVDEMQDTNNDQLQIITQTFDPTLCVVQCFGDQNQAIYNDGDNSSGIWQLQDTALTISTSRRLSRTVSKLSQAFSVYPRNFNGNESQLDRRHSIFLFDETSIQSVIRGFAKLVVAEGLADETRVIKAVGAVGKLNENPLYYSVTSSRPIK